MEYVEIPPVSKHHITLNEQWCENDDTSACSGVDCDHCLFSGTQKDLLKELWDIEPVRSMRL